ncbi:MAG: protoporphyrinogen oxidase [Nitrospiraceae bacterium]|nr:protoporphyrinogen oxidase [Nitrospiraceae bacterium]
MGRIAIVGGGISGLSTAYAILEKDPSAEIIIFEAEKKPGGKIWTEKIDGFLCEGGVNGFLDNKPKTLELSRKLLLSPLRSSDAARKRFIFSESRLKLIPETPPAFFFSNLLSFWGRLRIIYEILAPKGRNNDESLADFAKRRLGREAYEKLIDPMASGVYAGNPETLSLKSCFPRVDNLEQKYGSLIKGMIKMNLEAKKTNKGKIGAGPGGTLTSFFDGMEVMVDSLKNFLGDRLRTESRVVALEKKHRGYAVVLSDDSVVESEILIIASPAYAVSEMLRNFDKPLSSIIGEIPYPALSVICFGYKKERLKHQLNGFGFLVPFKEKRKILGTLWDSSIFPNRAPEGYALLRTMAGGARASEIAMYDDKHLRDMVFRELKDIMGIDAPPDFVKIFRHDKSIPQYNIGHASKMNTVEDMVLKHKDMYLTGNAYYGISVNDCIENSYKLAEKITGKGGI